MMTLFFMIIFFYFYYIVSTSIHFLVLLILIEFMVLFTVFHLFFSGVIFVSGLFFLLVGVCVGAYSICVYISMSRSNSSSYLLSIN